MPPPVIKSRTISAVEDKRVSLAGVPFSRSFANNVPGWTKLRIGLLLEINGGAGTITDPTFWIGLSHGSAARNLLTDAMVHWVGLRTTGSWLYYVGTSYGGPPEFYSYNWQLLKIVNNAGTYISPNIIDSGAYHSITISAGNRTMFFLDITKDTPSAGIYTIEVPLYRLIDQSAVDVSLANFNAQMALPTPSFASHRGTGDLPPPVYPVAQTIAVDETADGALDHINIGWTEISPQIEICALKIVVLQTVPPPPPTTYYNTEQTATCPFGPPSVIPAGTYSSLVSQATADQIAYDAAVAACSGGPAGPAYDDCESYSDGAAVSGLNGGTGYTGPYVT